MKNIRKNELFSLIINNDINAYLVDINEIENALNVFDETNIVQFEIKSTIFHEKVFVERGVLKTNIIYCSSQ